MLFPWNNQTPSWPTCCNGGAMVVKKIIKRHAHCPCPGATIRVHVVVVKKVKNAATLFSIYSDIVLKGKNTMKKLSKQYYFELAVFLMDYHGGQWSRGYRLLCRLNPRNLSSEVCEELRDTEAYHWLEQNYANRV